MSSPPPTDYDHVKIEVVYAVFLFIAIVAVVLRILGKKMNGLKYEADDWWIFLGLFGFLVLGTTFMASEILSVNVVVPYDAGYEPYVKLVYTGLIFYGFAAATTKLSVIFLYRKIFVTPSFRRWTWVLIGICTAWFLGDTFACIFVCNHPAVAWDESLVPTSYCYPLGQLLLGGEISEILVDVIILLSPVYMISKLQLGRSKRIAVCGVFLLGGFVVVTNIIRIYYSYEPATDSIFNSTDILWCGVHLGTAILCACLPTYVVLWHWISRKASMLRYRYSYRPSEEENSKEENSKETSKERNSEAGLSA